MKFQELQKIFTETQVLVSGEEFETVVRNVLPSAPRPGAIVYPKDHEEVTMILAWAKDNGVGVWPVSQGKNWGYGSHSPVKEGSLVLSLQKMNRIVKVDAELCYAVIEPGVTYRQLREHLEKNFPSLWCDCTDGPPDGSVLGNALDRGLGVTTYGDHFGTVCGLAVITPEGKHIRTGAGPEGCPTWNTHKWGLGPYIEGLFSQGPFGVVVEGGVWLLRKPEAFKSFTMDIHDEKKLPRLIDGIRELGLRDILRSYTHIINDITTLAVFTQVPPRRQNKNRLSAEEIGDLKKKFTVPSWSFGGGLAGTPAQIAEMQRAIDEELGSLGQIEYLDDTKIFLLEKFLSLWKSLGENSLLGRFFGGLLRGVFRRSTPMLQAAPHIHSLLKGKPSDYFVRHAYFKSEVPKPEVAHPDRDGVGLIWFAPIIPMTGKHLEKMFQICKPLYEKHDFDFYCALLILNARTLVVLQCIYYDKKNELEARRAKGLFDELLQRVTEQKYQCYRMPLLGMGKIYSTQPDLQDFIESLKRGVDKDGVLASGRYGIGG